MVSTRRFIPSLFACTTLLAVALCTPAQAVIYGNDDRGEYHEIAAEWQDASRAVVALIWAADIDDSIPDDIQFTSGIYGEDYNLCPYEPFYGQPDPAWCSGTLIANDLILTAGHCIDDSDCAATRFVFNYRMAGVNTLEPITVDDVFGCEEILVRETQWNKDYAVVRLDRDASAFTPASVQWGGLFEYSPHGSAVVDIGHPYGIPLKVADGAELRDGSEDFFAASTDSFHGNSGSGVYNSAGEIVGILVRGVDDFDYDSDGDCYVSRVCDEALGCDPSLGDPFPTFTRTRSFADHVPHDPFCRNGLCEPPEEDEFLCPEDCPQDSDYDNSPDVIDNCPWLPNPTQDNFDGDDLGNACDCDEDDAGCWSRPTTVVNLSLTHDQPTGWTVLTWDPPLEPGATSLVYDTLRSEFAMDFFAATCVESDDGLDLLSEDGEFPLEGMVYYYLVRAQNACPNGEGPMGGDWIGKPREGRPCPF
jgi:hypothetical protein